MTLDRTGNKGFFVEACEERLAILLGETCPPIYRLSPDKCKSILLSRMLPNTRTDSFSITNKEGINYHLITDETWLDDVLS